MAQHDYIIDNQNAPAARADINNVLAAIRTVNSGATAPASTIADMLWYETDTFTLWKRNAGNTAWVSMGVFNETTGKFAPNMTFSTQAEAETGVDNTTPMTPLRVAQAIAATVSTIDYQLFTVSGTWTKPAGISPNAIVIAQLWGGGGGGGRIGSNNAGGGGGGGYSYFEILASSLAATETVTVGSGGLGRTGSDGSGTTGGNSSLGVFVTAYGGTGGTGGAGASGGDGGGHFGTGSAGFGGGDGGINASSDTPGTNPDLYGGGGGSAGAGGTGTRGIFGGGGGGGINAGSTASLGLASKYAGSGGNGNSAGAGVSGSIPAGGGGAGGSNNNGGNGARGEVRIWTIG